MLSPALSFTTPRKLPKAEQLSGRVVVVDVAFAGLGSGFEKVTLPFITALGDRLRAWVDHHDHEEHARFADDPRFVLAKKVEHGACPEMIDPELVARVGPVETIVCHTDFDGLASAAKWMREGVEPYPGCDDDARAIDTRIGKPSSVAERFDRALRARPNDAGLFGLIVRHLATGLRDSSLWEPVDRAAAELIPVEQETRRAAQRYERLPPGIAIVDVRQGFSKIDKTLLLLLGQEREPVSVVVDQNNVAIAARFDSGLNFLTLFGLSGGMPTRVSLPVKRLPAVLAALGAEPEAAARFA
ncbi:MAG: hypothetical protein HS104_02880 [Polyangiaceae bacterium]|nr:hypothetical protein [Polyangiaceae bacterium]MCE7893409.1 hypothetical protein [Sorangiineae bacterium PRO1]MCL4751231.1 hypothetical protein [Myxococcales bacterium]